ncbi:GNAT family N-acetyltransferase [Mucilaginibacter flavidus]|uniref:GNAT family N-acetyltransferase n=1 Tax=Mucilaginibacter flavidus TaxID=2949309 RepID=UPI00209268F3|nr:GNAT family N-acetyltransferase [Mucilaginibacter flavidus]MCO5946660.1 GNAT family N-acetyltransferase [Mucilaginibacter flavidus]
MEYIIRPLMSADMPTLLVLMAEHAAYEKAIFHPDGKAERLLKAIFETPVRLYCEVAERQGELIGFVSYTYDFSTWDAGEFMHMDCLFLREEARGRGLGRTILTKLQQIAREKGCINIQWQTPDFNEPAIRFYKKNGAGDLAKVRFTYNL